MAGVARQQNIYYSGPSDSYSRRNPPLRADSLIAERNSRLLRSDPYEYGDEYPRKATRKKKVYRKKQSGEKVYKPYASRVHYPHIAPGEKAMIIFGILIVGVVLLAIIFFSAYSENIQNDINVKKANTAALQKDIDNLNIMIEEGKTIPNLEKKAKTIVGMKYPTSEDMVYLGAEESVDGEKIAEANIKESSE